MKDDDLNVNDLIGIFLQSFFSVIAIFIIFIIIFAPSCDPMKRKLNHRLQWCDDMSITNMKECEVEYDKTWNDEPDYIKLPPIEK